MSELGRDLQCQKCPTSFMWREDDLTTEYAARFNDWKVFQGRTEGGDYIRVVLCSVCGGSLKRTRVNRNEPLNGQEAFDF